MAITTTPNMKRMPDIMVSVRQLFGIDSDQQYAKIHAQGRIDARRHFGCGA